MMNKVSKSLAALMLVIWGSSLFAQAPTGYYSTATGKTGDELKTALHDIIKGHTSISYQQIWSAFWSTDNKGNNVVWDMYSDGANYTYNYYSGNGNDQCGEYTQEGDCFNREHSWPKSWFSGDEQTIPGRDLHHIFPTDGFVNAQRSSYPFGEVNNASWTSQNGSKLGTCKSSLGYSGTVFEPIDEYKGDFARAIMYMSVRYYSEDSDWGSSGMTNKSVIKPWAIAMLLNWSDNDPVSQKEIDRNEVVYGIQGNRNPFIDHPEYAHLIWEPGWSGTPYAITCATGLSHGSISAPSTAVAGTIVTLTATPNSGYELDTWTVTKTDDASTIITVSGNTFVMPNYAVTVSATFKVNNTLYNITQGTVSHGSFTMSANSAKSGTTIILTANPANGYGLYAWYVYKTSDINTHVSVTTTGNTGSFTMPAYDVTVLASFAQVSSTNYVKVTSAPSDWSGEYLIVNESDKKAFDGSLTALDANNNAISVTITNNSINYSNEADAAIFTIATMTGGYSIKAASGKYIGYSGNSNGLTVSNTALANTISLSGESTIIKGTGTSTLQYNKSANRFRYYSSSQQPIQLYKKISSTAAAPTHTIHFNGNGGNGTMNDQIMDEFVPTQLNTNTFTRQDYAFDSWNTAANGTGTTYFDGATITLLNDLTLYAQWKQLFAITLATVENGTVTVSHDQAVEGDVISLTASPATGYEFDHWNVIDASNNPIAVTENQFEMPASNVTVNAVFVYVGVFAQQYHLVTDVSQLVAGRTYLIVNTSAGKALGTTQNNNNRSAASVTISNNVIASIGNDVCELTLGGQVGAWTFFDAHWGDNGGYLYAAGGSSTNNYLKTQATLSDAGRWTIVFNANKATIKTIDDNVNRHTIRYNSSNDIFSCYASGQQDVYLFIRSEEYHHTESEIIANFFSFDKHTVHSGAMLTVSGTASCNDASHLVIEDGGQFIHHGNNVQATMKKSISAYPPNGGGWYTIAAPFASYTPAENMIVDNYDLYAYDEDANKEWVNYKAHSQSFYLGSGMGYLYAHNPEVTLRMSGTLNSGDCTQTINLSYGNSSEAIKGYNLLGNPTAHDISFTKTEDVSDGYYYLNYNADWVYSTTTTVPTCRGFLVKANAEGESVTLNPQSKRGVVETVLTPSLPESYLCISVDDNKAYVKLSEGVSMPLLNLNGHHTPLYLTREGKCYVMLVAEHASLIDLNYESHQEGTHTLKVNAKDLGLGYLHLIDYKTDADIDLLIMPEYTFEASPDDSANRFQLVFDSGSVFEDDDSVPFACFVDGYIIVNCEGAATLQIIDMQGRVVGSERISGKGKVTSNIVDSPSAYVLRLITDDAVRVQRIVVW